MRKEVVITGVGLRSSLANNFEDFVNDLANGIISISNKRASNFSSKIKYFSFLEEIPEYEPTNVSKKLLSSLSHLTLACAKDAFTMAGITDFTPNEKWGVSIGSGLSNLFDLYNPIFDFIEKGEKRAHPTSVPRFMGHAPSANVSLEFLLKGISSTNVNACVGGLSAIKDAYNYIASGEQDLMIAGGVDLSSNKFIVSSWENLRALSSLPNMVDASNPFHKNRNGFILGEGGCLLIIEEFEHAKKRGAKILAKIQSIHQTNSAFDIVKTHTPSEILTMNQTIEKSKIPKNDFQMIFYHATGTKLSAYTEFCSVEEVFKNQLTNIYASAIKSSIGHTIAASGPFSIVAAIGSFLNHSLYPIVQLNKDNIGDDFSNLKYITSPQKTEINNILINAFAFGGVNISCVLSKATN